MTPAQHTQTIVDTHSQLFKRYIEPEIPEMVAREVDSVILPVVRQVMLEQAPRWNSLRSFRLPRGRRFYWRVDG